MKCYLHIGTEKTGTTTLQEFFYRNRKELIGKGYYYPESLGLPNNRFLSLLAFNAQRRDDFTRLLGIKTDEELVNSQTKTLKNFTDELSSLPSSTKIICSNEHIQSRLTEIEEIQRLRNRLIEAGLSEMKVIVYLRNPSEIANSLYSTAIKHGHTWSSVPAPHDKYFENICHHKNTIEKFSGVFGKANVILRLFRKENFVNQSLLDDFLDVVGLLPFKKEFVLPENKNESLSNVGIAVLRQLNERIPNYTGGEANPQRYGLVSYIEKHCSNPKFAMSHELYKAYDEYFAESNRWVKENYFPDEEFLFRYTPPQYKELALSDTEVNQMADLIADLWLHVHQLATDEWFRFGRISIRQKLFFIFKRILKKITAD